MIDRRDAMKALAVTGGAALAARSAAAADLKSMEPANLPPAREAAGVRYRYAFSVSVHFKERVAIEAPARRAFVPAIGGEIWGPRLQGTVVPYGGADYGGGGGPLDAQYMFRSAEGFYIYINNRAYMRREDYDPVASTSRTVRMPAPGESFSQEFVAPPDSEIPLRMRTSPFFDAPRNSPHDWMNHTLFIGHGQRMVNPDRTIFTYFEVL